MIMHVKTYRNLIFTYNYSYTQHLLYIYIYIAKGEIQLKKEILKNKYKCMNFG